MKGWQNKHMGRVDASPGNRIPFFDIAKGIGILCMMFGHIGPWKGLFSRIVYPFHMPLFFLIAGWFINEEKNPRQYMKRRGRQGTVLCLVNQSLTSNMPLSTD